MENLENQSSSTFRSYSCFWPTIIVQLGILIKYCGSDFETDISFLSWLLLKLSESPIFLAMSGGKSEFEWASLKTHSIEWVVNSSSLSLSLTDRLIHRQSDECGNRTHLLSVVEKDEHLVPTQWAMSAGGRQEKFTWIYCSICRYHPGISRKIES